jgi:hypothetical protein
VLGSSLAHQDAEMAYRGNWHQTNQASGGRPYDPHVARHESRILPHGRPGHTLVYLCVGTLRSRASTGPLV